MVGTRTATSDLRDRDIITVDAQRGLVLKGGQTAPVPALLERLVTVAGGSESLATRLYVNLAIADRAEEIAALDVDGVGLLRGEFMVTEALGGRHPRALIAQGGQAEFISQMASQLTRIAAALSPRPVVYRTMEFRSNEFRGLTGGDEFENLQIMIPFVRTKWELEACLDIIGASRLGRQRGLKIWVMAEVPSVIARLDEYAALGIDGVSIGSNDLTRLMLGVDRDSETLADLFDARDPAVLWAIKQIVDGCHRAGISSSLCGLAPSADPDFAELLVGMGITSISVDADAIDSARRVLGAAEKRILLDQARRETRFEVGV